MYDFQLAYLKTTWMETEEDRTYQRYFQNQQWKQQIETPSSTALAFHHTLKVVEGLIHGYLTLSETKRGRDREKERRIM